MNILLIAIVLQIIAWFVIYSCIKSIRDLKKQIKAEKERGLGYVKEGNHILVGAPEPVKRKVFSVNAPRELSPEDCDRLAEESELYRNELDTRLNRLDDMSDEDWKTKVK